MFLNYIKDFFLKRIYKKKIRDVKGTSVSVIIETVGLLVDESYFFEKEALIKELIANGIVANNITSIVYSDKKKKTEDNSQLMFSSKDLNWKSEITNSDVNDFINKKFDLLISYYDVEKAILLQLTQSSKAKFKVGFSSVDKRLNHLLINTNAEKYTVFTEELFKYLQKLNKL